MPQVLKAEVRQRIVRAALLELARGSYAATTMSQIARRADMAVANLYRYFASKEELFEAAVPQALVTRFEELLEKSARAHAHPAGLHRANDADADAARELLDFWIEHRLIVIILLGRAQGSIHEAFGQRFVARLVALSVNEIRRAYPGVVIPREARLVLEQVFDNTRRMIHVLLEGCEGEQAIRRAVSVFRSYQVGGLAALARSLVTESPGSVDSER